MPRPQVQKPDNVVNADTALGRVHGLHCIPLAKVSCKASPDLSCGKTDFLFMGRAAVSLQMTWVWGRRLVATSANLHSTRPLVLAKVWSPKLGEGRPCRRGVGGGLSPASPLFLATIRNGTQVSSPAVLMTEQSGERPRAPVRLLWPLGPVW